MADSANWAGQGYRADDKFTVLFNEAVDAFLKVHDMGSSQYCAGLIHAYALVTGDAYHVVWDQVSRAARDLVASQS